MIHKITRWAIIGLVLAVVGFATYYFFFKTKAIDTAETNSTKELAEEELIDGLAKY